MSTKRTKRKQGKPLAKGRQVNDADLNTVRHLLQDGREDITSGRDLLIEHLHVLNDHFGGLTPEHIAALANVLGLAQVEVYETASFYAHFNITTAPPAPITVRICDGPVCQMAGAKALLKQALAAFGDHVTIHPAPCQGACDTPPAAMVGKSRIGHVDLETLRAALKNPPNAPASPDAPALTEIVCPPDLRDQLHTAGLRGMGGAGFAVARKWGFFPHARPPNSPERVLVVNADEGEPGTFKDRFLLETDLSKVLRGMLITAQALAVRDVFFYLRDEYPHIHADLKATFADLRLDGVRFHLRRGAGAYVCGEETALLNSLEGKRGTPRNRPPYPAQHGYKNRPTLTHNVETLYWIADIAERGQAAYVADGRPRFYSLSGRVRNPGVYRAASTTTVAQLIAMAGGMIDGHRLYAFLPGGASGGIFPARFADRAMDFGVFEELGGFVGSGALMVVSDHDDVTDVARTLTAFFAAESCGKCTPCRIGCEKLLDLMSDMSGSNADHIRDLSAAMRDGSICGLGQAAPNPLCSLLNHFAKGDP